MAVEPLYNSKASVIEKLRMSDTSDADTLTVIDQVISTVRTDFFRRLTLERAIHIQGLPSVENPTTADGILRSVAETTEVYWIFHKLVCILPTMYIETQFAIKDNFDDTPITRDADSIKDYLACLWASIEAGLGQLIDPVSTDSGNFQIFTTGAPEPVLLRDLHPGLPCSRL